MAKVNICGKGMGLLAIEENNNAGKSMSKFSLSKPIQAFSDKRFRIKPPKATKQKLGANATMIIKNIFIQVS